MITIALALLLGLVGACTSEDGQPDPPVQALVPCNPDAGSGDPEACPDLAPGSVMDGGADADVGVDGGADAAGAKDGAGGGG